MQNCAKYRHTMQIAPVIGISGKQTAQRREKLRKNSLGNYKSAALPTELCRRSGIRKLFYRVHQELGATCEKQQVHITSVITVRRSTAR
jgi:hypothetical protein